MESAAAKPRTHTKAAPPIQTRARPNPNPSTGAGADARSAMISLPNARLQIRIDLYLAQGGDFAAAPQQPRQLSNINDSTFQQ